MKKCVSSVYDRRRFLALGLLGGVSAAAEAYGARAALGWTSEEAVGATIGYWVGSDRLAEVRVVQQEDAVALLGRAQREKPLSSRVIDASSMFFGESELTRTGAKISVAGARFPVSWTSDPRRGVGLVALFESGSSKPLEFLCWRGRNGGRGRESSSIRFYMPAQNGLRFALETSDSRLPLRRAELALTPGWGWLKPKLRQGVYFLAGLRGENGPLPRWSDYRLRPVPSEIANGRFRLEPADGGALDFACLTLVVRKA